MALIGSDRPRHPGLGRVNCEAEVFSGGMPSQATVERVKLIVSFRPSSRWIFSPGRPLCLT